MLQGKDQAGPLIFLQSVEQLLDYEYNHILTMVNILKTVQIRLQQKIALLQYYCYFYSTMHWPLLRKMRKREDKNQDKATSFPSIDNFLKNKFALRTEEKKKARMYPRSMIMIIFRVYINSLRIT